VSALLEFAQTAERFDLLLSNFIVL